MTEKLLEKSQRKAEAFVDALDAYLDARTVLEKANADIELGYGYRIADLVSNEHSACEKARNALKAAAQDLAL